MLTIEDLADAEVQDLDHSLIEDDVLRLEVVVDDGRHLRTEVVDYACDLFDYHLCLILSYYALELQVLGQSVALAVLQHDADGGLQFYDLDQLNDIVVVQ